MTAAVAKVKICLSCSWIYIVPVACAMSESTSHNAL